MQITNFNDTHILAAARLVCQQYQSLHQQIPLLPERNLGVEELADILRDICSEAQGVVALKGDQLVGFMLGVEIGEFMGRRTMYSPDFANVACTEESSTIIEEMYTALAKRWVQQGYTSHAVSILANDEQALQAWHWLGFGLANVDGVRDLQPVPSSAEGIEVRNATSKDVKEVQVFQQELMHYMSTAPIFWVHELEDYCEQIDQPGYAIWLAYHEEQPVGYMVFVPGEKTECQFLRDPKTIYLASAFTFEAMRGKGIATELLNQGLDWAKKYGYVRCAVDFETMNPPAKHFWMKHFQPISYSLARVVDKRFEAKDQ